MNAFFKKIKRVYKKYALKAIIKTKKNRAFTLVELLAVIIILAVMVLIAIPYTQTTMNKSKDNAFRAKALDIEQSAKDNQTMFLVANQNLKAMEYSFDEGNETSSYPEYKVIKKGKAPTAGIVKINEQGNVALAIYENDRCAQKDYDDIDVIVSNVSLEECIDFLVIRLGDIILNDNEGSTSISEKTVSNFGYPARTNEGMYSASDNYGTSYYYRGAVDNNWVRFANFYWRIIRINGDGSIRMIYAGTSAPTSSESVVKKAGLLE